MSSNYQSPRRGEATITVEGVGKQYRLGEQQSGYGILSERVSEALVAPRRWLKGGPKVEREEHEDMFWALRDVSFEVHQGETLGIIGRNGAGKSTMLKLLSRITLPTEGRITMLGRVATLLEVGTGFHPELTGRENLYLNGTILGMRRKEVQARFDEIVEFAGVERFLDTPVKRYSSGMYIRLAFAIAAHLDPEVMLVDEVLAVGDTEFQKKCLGKIKDVAEAGRAIVFVSHNLHAIQTLCSRVILMEKGRVVVDGDPSEALTEYYDRISPEQRGGEVIVPADHPRLGAGGGRLVRACMSDVDGQPLTAVALGQPFRITAEFELEEEAEAVIEIGISTGENLRVATMFSTDGNRPPFRLTPGRHEITADFDIAMVPGEFYVDIALQLPGNITSKGTRTATADNVERVIRFSALSTDLDKVDHWPMWRTPEGYIRARADWQHVESEALSLKPG